MLPAVVSDGIYFVIVRWHEQYKNANLGKSVILFSFGFCRKYFRFTVLIKALYFLQALVFIEHWIMPENITPVRLELWEHQPHHTWWICPLKYGPRARPYEAPQCGLTICRHKREEDGGLRGRVEERNISHSPISQQVFLACNKSSITIKARRRSSKTLASCQTQPLPDWTFDSNPDEERILPRFTSSAGQSGTAEKYELMEQTLCLEKSNNMDTVITILCFLLQIQYVMHIFEAVYPCFYFVELIFSLRLISQHWILMLYACIYSMA